MILDENKIFDPITGVEITVYCCDIENNTRLVWRAQVLRAIADIQSEKAVSKEEAKRLLENSDINSPVVLKKIEYWVE